MTKHDLSPFLQKILLLLQLYNLYYGLLLFGHSRGCCLGSHLFLIIQMLHLPINGFPGGCSRYLRLLGSPKRHFYIAYSFRANIFRIFVAFLSCKNAFLSFLLIIRIWLHFAIYLLDFNSESQLFALFSFSNSLLFVNIIFQFS